MEAGHEARQVALGKVAEFVARHERSAPLGDVAAAQSNHGYQPGGTGKVAVAVIGSFNVPISSKERSLSSCAEAAVVVK
jgi:hypothetical protein